MPTYEYQCQLCGHEFEEYQSITAAPLSDCPEEGCEGSVKRLISAGAGLLFKGSGFYITDYRSEGYKASAKAESTSSTDSGSGESKGSGSDAKSTASGSNNSKSKSSEASASKE